MMRGVSSLHNLYLRCLRASGSPVGVRGQVLRRSGSSLVADGCFKVLDTECPNMSTRRTCSA
eukprot:7771258-Lingulodinium_polyedra.AAC.1